MLRSLFLDWPARAVDAFGRGYTLLLAAAVIVCITNVLLLLILVILS